MERSPVHGRRALTDEEENVIVETNLMFSDKGIPLLRPDIGDAVEIFVLTFSKGRQSEI